MHKARPAVTSQTFNKLVTCYKLSICKLDVTIT